MQTLLQRMSVMCALILTLAYSPAQADVLHLKSGRRAEGKLISNDGKTVVFEYGGQTLRLPVDMVEKIEAGDADSATTPLADAVRDQEAGRLRRAWQAYREALEKGGLTGGQAEQARQGIQAVLNAGAAECRKTIPEMGRDYLKHIEHAQQQRMLGNPEAYDNLVWRRVEAILRCEAAARMMDGSQIGDARTQLEAVSDSGDQFALYRATAGRLEFICSNWERAAEHLGEALKEISNDSTLQAMYVMALFELGRMADIVAFWEENNIEFGPNGKFAKEALLFAACAYSQEAFKGLDEGRPDEAKKLYAKSMRLRETDVAMLREAAEFYARAGDQQMADRMRQRAEAEAEAARRRMAAMQTARTERAAEIARIQAQTQENIAQRNQESQQQSTTIQRTIRATGSTSSG